MAYGRIILGFMIATAFLSMWIPNTATTIMMTAYFAYGFRLGENESWNSKTRSLL